MFELIFVYIGGFFITAVTYGIGEPRHTNKMILWTILWPVTLVCLLVELAFVGGFKCGQRLFRWSQR